MSTTRIASWLMMIVAVVLAILRSFALAAHDRYWLEIPHGLAWSDFGGYETWQDVAVSQTKPA